MLGEKAKSLGLIDGFGDVDGVVKDLAGGKAKAVYLKPKRQRGLLRLVMGGAMESAFDIAEQKLLTPTLR
jgi:ClpP class serine protease